MQWRLSDSFLFPETKTLVKGWPEWAAGRWVQPGAPACLGEHLRIPVQCIAVQRALVR